MLVHRVVYSESSVWQLAHSHPSTSYAITAVAKGEPVAHHRRTGRTPHGCASVRRVRMRVHLWHPRLDPLVVTIVAGRYKTISGAMISVESSQRDVNSTHGGSVGLMVHLPMFLSFCCPTTQHCPLSEHAAYAMQELIKALHSLTSPEIYLSERTVRRCS